jgi:hypothetical protein
MRITPVYIFPKALKIGTILKKPKRIMQSLTAHVLIAACALGWALFSSLPT